MDDQITLSTIFDKIMTENLQFDEIKYIIFPVLRKVSSFDQFFEILYKSTKEFLDVNK